MGSLSCKIQLPAEYCFVLSAERLGVYPTCRLCVEWCGVVWWGHDCLSQGGDCHRLESCRKCFPPGCTTTLLCSLRLRKSFSLSAVFFFMSLVSSLSTKCLWLNEVTRPFFLPLPSVGSVWFWYLLTLLKDTWWTLIDLCLYYVKWYHLSELWASFISLLTLFAGCIYNINY